MKISYQLEAELYHYSEGILPGAEDFISKYAAYRSEPTTTYVFSDEQQLEEAMSLLAKHRLSAERFYKFELTPNELATYPALYLGLYCTFEVFIIDEGKKRVNATVLDGYEIVQDYESDRIVVSPRVKKILENTTKEVHWESIETTNAQEWFIMQVMEILPEPIVVPFPVSVEPEEDPAGTYAVRSDGRAAIAEANISKLAEVGIALSLEVQTPLQLLKWRPRFVASGAVIYAMQLAGVKDILELTGPLLPESHPLIQGSNLVCN
jgi:hypothetical protein